VDNETTQSQSLLHPPDSGLGDVMVVGGGISGIQAALDMATAGFKVYLVEKAPTIGGKMAQLDKTFPTNDCSMCIESPKFIECDRHPNIEIMTYTEVDSVEGEAGDFTVTLTKKARYVKEDVCTGCNTCVEYCPINVPDEYNQNLSDSKAIHIYFSQAVPLVTYVDEEHCLYLKDKKCNICVGVCKNAAIDLHMKPEKVKVNVGAIVLSPGYEVFNPRLRGDYGYGTYQNVVTSLDFERLLCSTGPFEGEVLRPSDGKHPHNVAWIHCVGSRQVIEGGNTYCSAVCCSYTQKQVILQKDHDPDSKCTIFHNDIRSYGKDFERFYQRAANLSDTRFIRSYVSVGREDPETKNVTIRYATENGVKEEEFDMVVLSVGLNPPTGAQHLADTFGIDLDDHGFCKNDPQNPILTSRPGVFVSGAFQGPLDIPESVVTASGAGSLSGELLNYRRGKLARDRVYPTERDVTEEEPKVGVFLCHCGANIGRVVDIPDVVEYSKELGNVVHAEDGLFICSTDAAQQISETIKEKGLNRVVVAACTPRTHEPLFRDTLREAGINQYYFDFANIREHCSWVHSREKEEATAKAKDIVRMSVARSCMLEPLEEYDLPVNKTCLVVGGGIAGMTSALSLATQGFETYLVEKEHDLGGMARRFQKTLEGLDVAAFVDDLAGKVYRHPQVHVITDAAIKQVAGYVGNFTTTVVAEGRTREIEHGAAILAIGADEHKPTEYLYGEHERVITQLELEEKLHAGEEWLEGTESVVMIQCVGCREKDRNYCARVCCNQAVKNALTLKEAEPGRDVYVLFRDMRTYGFAEDYYREASNKGVRFIRYEAEEKPVVEANGDDALTVTLPDAILGKRLAIDADAVVLSAAVVPSAGATDVAKMFKVAQSPDGFFQEAHVKLRPVDFAADGVFLCGTAHYPKHITETVGQAYGAAGRAITLLSQDTVTASGSVCGVYEDKCIGCGACISACTYGAIQFYETRQGNKVSVNPVLCKGDGLCNAKCPTGAIYLKHYTDDEVLAQIDAAIPELESEKVAS
jgi:heterodisulfide reductase subunit A